MRRGFSQQELKKRFRLDEFLAEGIITTVSLFSLGAIVLIFVFVFREAIPSGEQHPAQVESQAGEEETYGGEFLGDLGGHLTESSRHSEEGAGVQEGEVSVGNLLSTTWQPISSNPRYGLLPLVIGTLKVTLIALLVATPLAILAALFTSSFAPKSVREILKPCIELLAGFPSVVIGFFALTVLASGLQHLLGLSFRLNALVGGIAMSLAVIPIIYTVSEDALSAVPGYLNQASLALGATPWQTALHVTLPAATPGVFAAVLLGFGRAFGETMIVLMATGNAALLTFSVADPVRTMSATIGAEMAEVVFGDVHYSVLFILGAVLFAFTFLLNAAAEIFIRQRLLRRFRGG